MVIFLFVGCFVMHWYFCWLSDVVLVIVFVLQDLFYIYVGLKVVRRLTLVFNGLRGVLLLFDWFDGRFVEGRCFDFRG